MKLEPIFGDIDDIDPIVGASAYEKELIGKLKKLCYPEAKEAAAVIKRIMKDRAALRAELRNLKRDFQERWA